ncbi:MAG: hypothetical protein QOE92_1111 [Chloroflexota bacterium]|nr:hypothetical protein [Chloroflexota bacterium]
MPGGLLPVAGMADASPSPVIGTVGATPSDCFKTLKFGGSLYLDADVAVPQAEVGDVVGETDPNPATCGLPDRLSVRGHTGHPASEEVVYVIDGRNELFRSGGSTGYPYQDLVRWLVVALVAGIILFAALPAVINHIRNPPIGVEGEPDYDERGEVPPN